MTIFWTKKSKLRFHSIREHLESEFGLSSQKKFTTRVLDFMELLSKFPELGLLEVPDKNIYGFQLTKHTRLFYRIEKSHISILTFFDSRQDPKKRPNEQP